MNSRSPHHTHPPFRRPLAWWFLLPILVAFAQPGVSADDAYNWLQLRRLNATNQDKLRLQQQRLKPPEPAAPALNRNPYPGQPGQREQLQREMLRDGQHRDIRNLEQMQQLQQKQLQGKQRGEQSALHQRLRARGASSSNAHQPRLQLQRFRRQQQNQLDTMRIQSTINRPGR